MARTKSHDDADFIGPLRIAVGAGLAYMIWLALRASTPFPSDKTPSDLDATRLY